MEMWKEQFCFPNSNLVVEYDSHLNIEIREEWEKDGMIVDDSSVIGWQFKTEEAWDEWLDFCIDYIQECKEQFELGLMTEEEISHKISRIEEFMNPSIYEALEDDFK